MKIDKDYLGVQKILKDDYGVSVGIENLPSMQQFEIWGKFVLWADGIDPEGRFLCFCPLHDMNRRDEGSGLISFGKGMFWCNTDPSCLGQRAMSFPNVYLRLAQSSLT